MFRKIILFAVGLGLIAIAGCKYIETEIGAYHFHTYFYDPSDDSIAEALALRKKVRVLIKNGTLPDCSIARIDIGWLGPHPFSQYEVCCNKTSYAAAASFFIQNHGNLSVLIHPLTIYHREDHEGRVSWLGQSIPLYTAWMKELPSPHICPVYPDFPDEIPPESAAKMEDFPHIPGTEGFDYNMAKIVNS